MNVFFLRIIIQRLKTVHLFFCYFNQLSMNVSILLLLAHHPVLKDCLYAPGLYWMHRLVHIQGSVGQTMRSVCHLCVPVTHPGAGASASPFRSRDAVALRAAWTELEAGASQGRRLRMTLEDTSHFPTSNLQITWKCIRSIRESTNRCNIFFITDLFLCNKSVWNNG